ncbi:MAG: hypothetical protein ACLPXB_19330 [Thiobacillaceae bacterium]
MLGYCRLCAYLLATQIRRRTPRVRLKFSIKLNYEIDQPGRDFIFSIHAAQTPHQIVVSESLNISQSPPSSSYIDLVTHTRFLRL